MFYQRKGRQSFHASKYQPLIPLLQLDILGSWSGFFFLTFWTIICLFTLKGLQLKLSASTLVGISKLRKLEVWKIPKGDLFWKNGRCLLGGAVAWGRGTWCNEWEATLFSKEESSSDGRGRGSLSWHSSHPWSTLQSNYKFQREAGQGLSHWLYPGHSLV